MPNTPVPAAATGLPTATIIPFPRPRPGEAFLPIIIDLQTVGVSENETALLRLAAAALKFDPIELRDRFALAAADTDGLIDGWNTLAERMVTLADMVAEADRRIAIVREGHTNG